ncbi:MAG TPA: oligosaccharide flippase family protein [bacterium]|nr:oligosaccharide flippase family protein [bacterium]
MSLYKNSSIYVVSTFLLKGTSFLLLPVYSYFITPESFGIIFLVQTTAGFMTAFLSLSLWSSVSRFYFDYERRSEINSMYSTMIAFLTGYLIIIYSIVYFNVHHLANLLEVPLFYVRVGVFISFLDIFLPHLIALLRASEKAGRVAIIRTSLGVTGLIIQVIMVIKMQDKVAAFLYAKLITAALGFTSFWIFSYKYLNFNIKWFQLKDYLKYSLHSLPGDIANWLVNFADRFMVNKISGNAATGIYSVGYKLGHGQNLFQNSINEAYVPYVFSRYSNLEKYNKTLDHRAGELFAIFTIIAANSIVFIRDIALLFEESYRSLVYFFPMVALAYLINGYKLIFHNPLAYNKKYMKYKSMIWILAAVLNIGLNLILIPIYDYYGAAFATLISYTVTFIILIILVKRAVPVRYRISRFIIIFLISLFYSGLYLLPFSPLNLAIKLLLAVLYAGIILKISGLYTIIKKYFKGKGHGISTD